VTLTATVIVPTHDHGPTLRPAVESALAQTVKDIEIFVIGDGVPDITREIVGELARADERVRFFDHPKGPRHGEIYRHEALENARGRIVCYLSDDDLWFSDHVETVSRLLADADFAGALAAHFTEDGELLSWPADLALQEFRERMLSGRTNYVPLSCAAHTLTAYRRLPEGWSTTPGGVHTDLYMWCKFLRESDVRLRSTTRPTVLHFPSTHRTTWTAEERIAELERWATRLADPAEAETVRGEVLDRLVRRAAEIDVAADALQATRTWRLREWVLGARVFGTAARALAARAARRGAEP
jgi:GalNAc5-diNAcBac-PP-undecaprenol beta-1,3-glucosyltransferase